jgi:hypothetical protein
MRESGFSVLSEALAGFAGASAIDFAILLTAGRVCVPDGFAMTVLFGSLGSAVLLGADLATADTVFFAVTDFTADLPVILCGALFIAEFAPVRLPVAEFVALTLTA